ncbi:hypothetical protein BDZ89DRAFT_1072030, partial [Hymenopellis radicata]
MAPNYVVPPNATGTDGLGCSCKTMDDEKFMWSMFPTSLNIPPLSKAQAVPYLKDFKVLTVTEPNDSTSCHAWEAVPSWGTSEKRVSDVLNFVPSKIEGELPKISTYTEFMDSKALTDFQAAEAKSKAALRR